MKLRKKGNIKNSVVTAKDGNELAHYSKNW